MRIFQVKMSKTSKGSVVVDTKSFGRNTGLKANRKSTVEMLSAVSVSTFLAYRLIAGKSFLKLETI